MTDPLTVRGSWRLRCRLTNFRACPVRTLGALFLVVTIASQGGPALLLNYYDATIVLVAVSLLWLVLLHPMRDLFIIGFIFSLHLLEAVVAAAIAIIASSNKKLVVEFGRCFDQVSEGFSDAEGLS